MAEAAVISKKEKKSKSPAQKIPGYLVYEVSGGKPIYDKGYKDVINKTKTLEEIKMESQLQAGLKARISAFIGLFLLKLGYEIASGELGINLSKTDKRGADFAIYKSENWKWEAKFSDLPPEVVIEVDTQAELEGITEVEYVSQKIKDYHAFGVKKVIWIFTKGKLVFVATPELPWLTYDWDTEIEVVEGVTFKLNEVVKAV